MSFDIRLPDEYQRLGAHGRAADGNGLYGNNGAWSGGRDFDQYLLRQGKCRG